MPVSQTEVPSIVATSTGQGMSLERELPDLSSDSKCVYNGSELSIDLGLEYSGTVLFETSSISLQHGIVYGLVGANGAGKSSLFDVLHTKIIPGFPDLSTTLVRSDQNFDEKHGDLPAKEFLARSLQEYHESLSARICHLEKLLEDCDDEERTYSLAESLSRAYDMLDNVDIEDGKKEIQNTLNALGFKVSGLEKVKVMNLSGGWRMKCQLAKAASSLPELLLVDEPSFLDEGATEWLFQFLKQAAKKGSIVVITSHKKNVLAKVCERVLHLNSSKQLKQFNGSYNSFLTSSAQKEACICAREEKLNKKEEAHTKAVSKLKKKIEKGEKGLRSTILKNGADQRFIKGRSKEKKQRAGKSISVKTKLLRKEKDELGKLQKNDLKVQKLSVSGEKLTVSGTGLVVFNDVSFSYEHSTPVLRNVELSLSASDRVALVGENGTGKSTLVKLIVGGAAADIWDSCTSFQAKSGLFSSICCRGLKTQIWKHDRG